MKSSLGLRLIKFTVIFLFLLVLVLVFNAPKVVLHGSFDNKNAKIKVESTQNEYLVSACKTIVEKTVSDFDKYLGSLKSVVIHNDSKLRRGLANAEIVYVKCLPDLEEFTNVLVHELGHVIDLGYLNADSKGRKTAFDDYGDPIYDTDPSYEYYKLSWESNSHKHREVFEDEFVSGYATSDPFEDFAEAFMMYVRYNSEFLAYAYESKELMNKYNFIQKEVFDSESNLLSFNSGSIIESNNILQKNRYYDATRFHQYVRFSL